MGCIVNMFLEKVFNLGYLGFNHDSNSYGLCCGQRRRSLQQLVRLDSLRKKIDETNQTYLYPTFYRRVKCLVVQEKNEGFLIKFSIFVG